MLVFVANIQNLWENVKEQIATNILLLCLAPAINLIRDAILPQFIGLSDFVIWHKGRHC